MPFQDIVIAIHGIGSQSRFSTVRSVATQLAGSQTLSGHGKFRPVAPQPLGYFHSDVKSATSVRLVDDVEGLKGCDLENVGFAEVFWADIPQEVVAEGRTLEETQVWARTVVARAQALCERAKKDPTRHNIVPPDFTLAGEVLDEVIETIYVLENLTFIAEKAGLFSFDLRTVLEEYLGDVQLVTEFTYYRTVVVTRFYEAMRSINEQFPDARLHIVAHSEGTVVSFLGLLHAMSGHKLFPPDPRKDEDARIENTKEIPAWLRQVRGYMTIGSPLDKHILLWPRLWEKFDATMANKALPAGQIRWRNYYDYGDPVGFNLDSTRLWLDKKQFTAFEFCGCKQCHHDIGFARYLLPGAAHNEYWNDGEVFEHFIAHVVKPEPAIPKTSLPHAPRTKPLIAFVSPLLPYAASFVILLIGVYAMFKTVYAYSHPTFDPLQKFVRFEELGVKPPEGLHGWPLLATVLGITSLICGATLLARFPRLATGKLWVGAGFASLVVGAGLYIALVPEPVRMELGDRFWYLRRWFGVWAPTAGILGLTAIAAMTGFLAMSPSFEHQDRRQRWLLRGMRPLMICGAIAIGLVILAQLFPREITSVRLQETRINFTPEQTALIQNARLTPEELRQIITNRPTDWVQTVQKVEPILATGSPIWPVILAGAGFLYLWWLSTLLFGLAFVWHRYIRHSTTNNRLREWNAQGLPPHKDRRHGEACRNPHTLHIKA